MKTITLTLKKKWFDMIASGEKKEEYREIKDYWIKRLFINHREYFQLQEKKRFRYASFNKIIFRNGYKTNSPSFEIECVGIEIGYGLIHWGAEKNKEYFIIKLGEKLTQLNKPT